MKSTTGKNFVNVNKLMSFLTIGILAGGASKRFGSPKYQALLSGQTLLDHATQTASQLSRQVIISCGHHKCSSSLQQVFDPPDGQYGPVSGIHTLLENTATPWLMTLPVDMPLVTTETLEELANHRLSDKPVACFADGRNQPLVAIWPHTLRKKVSDISRSKGISVIQLMEQLNCVYVESTSQLVPKIEFANINRINDLEKLRKALSCPH